ncbi:hypothetical protein [Brevibacterium litoralis]|uniref:hypothetical protein n=1 Tax=Brevibacterium litoralis TaxID=3138935 RepID=UPI0032EF9077
MTGSQFAPHLDDFDAEGLSPTTSHRAYVAAAPERFWSLDDPAAPFGTDTGWDTLAILTEHYPDGGEDGHIVGAFASLLGDWGLVPEEIWTSSQAEIEAWLAAAEDHESLLYAEIQACIAAACAHSKISGWIHPVLRFWAERALMLLEHVLRPRTERTWGADEPGTDPVPTLLESTRAVLTAAPEPPPEHRFPEYEL